MRSLFFCLLLFAGHLAAQEPQDFLLPDPSALNAMGIRSAYLHEPDSAESYIKNLLALARQQHSQVEVLKYLQLALVLENYAPRNTPTTFELNRQLGTALLDLNPRYALFFMKKAVAISEADAKLNPGERFPLAGAIAGMHYALQEPDSSLLWYRKALAEAFAHHAQIGRASAMNNLGVFYSRTGRYDSAMVYYRNALQTLGGLERDAVLYCSIQDNMAQERMRVGDYAAALSVYRFNDTVYTQRNRYKRVAGNRLKILEAEKKMGNRDIAPGIERLRLYVEDARSSQHLAAQDAVEFYQFAKNYFFENRQLEAAQRYDRLLLAARDTVEKVNKTRADILVNAFLQTQAIRFKRDMAVYELEAEAERKSLRSTQLMIVLALFACAIGLILLAVLLRKRQRELEMTRRLAEADLRAKEFEARALAQALELKKRDVTTVALQTSQVLDNSRRVRQRLSEIVRQKADTTQAVHSLIQDLQTQEQLGERSKVVQENIDQVNAEFYHALKSRFPTLSKSEIELCGYLRINLSNKDIALLKNGTPAAVKVSKNRLRKKLSLERGEDLVAFLQGI